jgi:hypothetical protein
MLSDEDRAGIQELVKGAVDAAVKATPVPSVTPAVVTSVRTLTNVMVIVDAPQVANMTPVPVPAQSLMPLKAGQRVEVLFLPSHGALVLGVIGGPPPPSTAPGTPADAPTTVVTTGYGVNPVLIARMDSVTGVADLADHNSTAIWLQLQVNEFNTLVDSHNALVVSLANLAMTVNDLNDVADSLIAALKTAGVLT